ncbi:hypothetical protein D3C81_1906380 [compost metagenome]
MVLQGGLAVASAGHAPLADGELFLDGVLPDVELHGDLVSTTALQTYTTNDYDLEGQV